MKTNKRKVWKCFKSVMEFSGNWLSESEIYVNFLGVFARIVKFTHFAQVMNFREVSHGMIHPRKLNKKNREPGFFHFCLFFSNTTAKESLLSLLHNKSKNRNLLSLYFCRICFWNELFTHALAKGVDQKIKQTKQSVNKKQTFLERL